MIANYVFFTVIVQTISHASENVISSQYARDILSFRSEYENIENTSIKPLVLWITAWAIFIVHSFCHNDQLTMALDIWLHPLQYLPGQLSNVYFQLAVVSIASHAYF